MLYTTTIGTNNIAKGIQQHNYTFECVSIYISIYIYTYTHAHTCVYTSHMCIYLYIYLYIYIYIYIHTHKLIYVYIHHTCVYIYIYIRFFLTIVILTCVIVCTRCNSYFLFAAKCCKTSFRLLLDKRHIRQNDNYRIRKHRGWF